MACAIKQAETKWKLTVICVSDKKDNVLRKLNVNSCYVF